LTTPFQTLYSAKSSSKVFDCALITNKLIIKNNEHVKALILFLMIGGIILILNMTRDLLSRMLKKKASPFSVLLFGIFGNNK